MRSEQDGAIERVVRDGPGGRSRDRVKPMSGSLTLLFIRQCNAVSVDKINCASARGT